MISPFSSLASSPRSGPLSPTMPIIESPGYNETEYNDNDNGENEYNENESGEYNDESGEYNENDGNGENDEYNDESGEYNDSDAQYDNASPNVAATSSLIVITAASRPRGIGAWLAHVERERRGSSILARLRSLVF